MRQVEGLLKALEGAAEYEVIARYKKGTITWDEAFRQATLMPDYFGPFLTEDRHVSWRGLGE